MDKCDHKPSKLILGGKQSKVLSSAFYFTHDIWQYRIIEKNINAGRFLAKIDDRPRVAPGPPSSGLARSGGKDKEALVKRYSDAVLLKYAYSGLLSSFTFLQ